MRKQARNVSLVGFSTVFQVATTFLRGALVARLLGVQEFGYAVIIISITGALDIFADAGIDRFLVQSRFGYRPDMVRTSHTYRVFGSLIVGLGVAACAYPLALLFHAPEMWPAIAATGGVVILRGFVDLSYKLQQRDHDFGKEVFIDLSRVSADLAFAVAIAVMFHSYVAVLIGAYANALTQLILSRMTSVVHYSFLPRRKLLALVGRFSVPIYINASVLFLAMQGDRMLVASMFSKRQLALYVVACTVGQGITSTVGRIVERVSLPVLSKPLQSRQARRTAANALGLLISVGALVFLAGIWIFGPFTIHLIYGPAYTGITDLIFASAIFQMIQILQSWLNSVLIANGITASFPLITLMRSVALPIAVVMANMGFALVSVPLAFAVGASASLATSFWALRKEKIIDVRLMVGVFLLIAISITVVASLSAVHWF